MGCHTWFYRPLTKDEFKLMKEYAPTAIKESYEIEISQNSDFEFKHIVNRLLKSIEENIPCVYGHYWYEFGWGSDSTELGYNGIGLSTFYIENKLYAELSCKVSCPFFNTSLGCDSSKKDCGYGYHDIFRVKNYPKYVIHNKKELRKRLRKKYFLLTKEQHELLDKFWKEYPDGIIDFG